MPFKPLTVTGLALVVATVGCRNSDERVKMEMPGEAASTTATTLFPPGVPRLTDSTLGELRYPAPDLPTGWVRLHGGEWKDTVSPTEVREAYLTKTVRGDLNGDTLPDAVVVLFTDPGATGKFYSLVPVTASRTRRAEFLNGTVGRSSYLGDRVVAESLWVDRQRLMLRIRNQAEDDPLCCPTLIEQRTYKLAKDSLVLDSTVVLKRLVPDQ